MKKLTFCLCLAVLAFGTLGLAGCSSGGESPEDTKAAMDKINKELPPSEKNPPPIPTRDDGGKVGKAK